MKNNMILTISSAVGATGFIMLGIGFTKVGGVMLGIASIGVALS